MLANVSRFIKKVFNIILDLLSINDYYALHPCNILFQVTDYCENCIFIYFRHYYIYFTAV